MEEAILGLGEITANKAEQNVQPASLTLSKLHDKEKRAYTKLPANVI